METLSKTLQTKKNQYFSLGLSLDSNNSKTTKTTKNTRSRRAVNSIARTVTEKLNNPDRLNLYRKYAWRLSEGQINNNLEMALAGNNPKTLFTWLCERDLAED